MKERLSNASFQKKKKRKQKPNLNNQSNQTHPINAHLKIINYFFKYGHIDNQEAPGQTETQKGSFQRMAARTGSLKEIQRDCPSRQRAG